MVKELVHDPIILGMKSTFAVKEDSEVADVIKDNSNESE